MIRFTGGIRVGAYRRTIRVSEARKLARMAHGGAAAMRYSASLDTWIRVLTENVWKQAEIEYRAALALDVTHENLMDAAGMT